MNNTLVTLEDRELSAVRGGWGRGFGCGGYGDSGYGYGQSGFGYGFHRFGFGGFGLGGDDDCGAETDLDIRPAVSYCATGCETVAVGGCGY